MSENYMLLPFKSAAPFWSSILFAVSLWFSFFLQGWAILFVPILTLLILPLVDQYVGLRVENLEPDIEESRLFWYRLITLIWAPIQFITLFGILALAISADMTLLEKIGLFCAIGVLTGTDRKSTRSELQSHSDLVCRLLLEKKKKKY